jgi:hypothetical protein
MRVTRVVRYDVAATTQFEWIHSEILSYPLPSCTFALELLFALSVRLKAYRNPIMRPDLTSHEMAALLQILERVERAIDEAPVASLRQLAELHDEARSELATAPAVEPVDPAPNRFVERIAAAMMRVRVQEA